MANLTLFLDDDLDTLSMYKAIFKNKGLYVSNIPDAFLQYQIYKPKLIFLDFFIKGEHPLDFIEYVKKDNSKVDIYVITGYSIAAPLRLFNFNLDHLFKKPVELNKLKILVERMAI